MPLVKSLHRLPVQYRIIVTIWTITYQALSCNQPSHLYSLFTDVRKPTQLRLSNSDLLVVSKNNTNIATMGFSESASMHTLWDMLHSSVTSNDNIAKFRHHL